MILMRTCMVLLAGAALCLAADAPKSYTGVIGDDMCGGDHKAMGGTDAGKCTVECVQSMKAKYALWIGKDVYVLSDQTTPAGYAGKKVTVTGTLVPPASKDAAKVIQVKSIAPAH
jgi:hypothetical protein